MLEVAHRGPVRDAADREPYVFAVATRRAGHDREIAMRARELAEREASPARGRERTALDQLVIVARASTSAR
jgi:hypothetical protein